MHVNYKNSITNKLYSLCLIGIIEVELDDDGEEVSPKGS